MISNDEKRAMLDAMTRFASQELNVGVSARERTGFDRALWKKCGDFKLQSLTVPETCGGLGLGAGEAAQLMRHFGYACEDNGTIFSVAAHLVAVAMPVALHGTAAQKARYFPGLADGTLVGAHALTEPDSGSDAFSMRTTAVKRGNHYVLNGAKTFITNGPVADVALVFAVTDAAKKQFGGISAFLIDLSKPGVERGRPFEKMGLRTSPLGELVFHDVKAEESDVLGGIGAGAGLFTQSMNWERTLLFAAQVGTMQRLLEKTIQYARTRKQFGKAIGKNQAVAHAIADMKLDVEVAGLLVEKAAAAIESARGLCVEASLAKLFVSEALQRTTARALHLHGGFGYMTESGLEREVRDATAATIYSGSSEIQRELIAKSLGL